MNVDEIAAFVSIVRLGGFARAAHALNRSQPAISRRVDMLEQELRTAVFERLPAGVVLTEAGRMFLPYAEAVLSALKDGTDAVRGLEHGHYGTVTLALVGTLASTKLTAALRALRRHSPGINLELLTATSREVSDMVRRGEATMGLRYFTDANESLVSTVVMEEALVTVCAAEHRLAGRLVRDANKLAGERWVAFPPQRGRREPFVSILEQRLAAAGIIAPDLVRIDSLTAQKRFVEAGFGIALLVESSIQEELGLGTLKIIDVPALRGTVPITLVRRRNGYLGPAAQILLAAINRQMVNPAPKRRGSAK